MDNHKKNIKYKEYEIIAKTIINSDTVLFKFKGKFKFNPGQFVQVMLPHFGEATFAICSSPENTKEFEICIRACGNTTNQLIKKLPKETMLIRGPYGNGWPVSKFFGKNLILIAGGMGLVPIRPLILQILKYRREFKNIHLILGFKHQSQILFEEDLKNWKSKFNSMELYTENGQSNFWEKRGLITEPIKNLKIKSTKNLNVALCGPEIMFDFCIEELLKKGVKEKDIFVSFERRMECGIGVCQHCNIGKFLVCKDGPVFRWDIIKEEINK